MPCVSYDDDSTQSMLKLAENLDVDHSTVLSHLQSMGKYSKSRKMGSIWLSE